MKEKKIRKIVGCTKRGTMHIDLCKLPKRMDYKINALSASPYIRKKCVNLKKPSISDIIKFLEKEIPVILFVSAYFLYNKPSFDGNHSIIITDYKDGIFYFNDPLDGKRHKITLEDLMRAWFAESLFSSLYLLAIWK